MTDINQLSSIRKRTEVKANMVFYCNLVYDRGMQNWIGIHYTVK
jgi:hypothetical protein